METLGAPDLVQLPPLAPAHDDSKSAKRDPTARLSCADTEVGSDSERPTSDDDDGHSNSSVGASTSTLAATARETYTAPTPQEVTRDLKSATRAAVRAFVYAYGAKAVASVLLAARKRGGVVGALRQLAAADTIRFGAFMGSLVGVFRFSEVATRLVRGKKDETNLAIAGGLSGLTLLLDARGRRTTISLYIFMRMLDIVGRRLTSAGVLPAYEYSSEMLFALSNSAIMYGFFIQPATMTKGYYNWVLSAGGLTHAGLQHTIRERLHDVVDASGVAIPFRACQPHYHTESCARHGVSEWLRGLSRAARMYIPVHVIPALVFKLQQLKAAPQAFVTTVSLAALRSSVFLTSYQTVAQLAICAIRNTFERDFHLSGWISGLLTGATLFLESPKRRSELMLYCALRGMEIVWQLLKRRGLVRYIKHSEVALFSLSLAVIMSSPPEHVKPTYRKLLRFVFGATAM